MLVKGVCELTQGGEIFGRLWKALRNGEEIVLSVNEELKHMWNSGERGTYGIDLSKIWSWPSKIGIYQSKLGVNQQKWRVDHQKWWFIYQKWWVLQEKWRELTMKNPGDAMSIEWGYPVVCCLGEVVFPPKELVCISTKIAKK